MNRPRKSNEAARSTSARVAATAALLVLTLARPAWLGAEEEAVRRPRDIPFVNHVVQPGETLSKLAKRYYGDEYLWPKIHECNRWIDPNHLRVGQTICIPEPSQGTKPAGGRGSGLFDWLTGGSEKEETSGATSAPPKPAAKKKEATVTQNPGGDAQSWKAMIQELLNTQCFGRPLSQILILLVSWFVVHMVVQGAFTWFAAHMAFVKEVSFKKAWRATMQSETLAALFVGIVGVAGLGMIYVATAPPGKPVVSELLMIAEQYLSSPSGMAIAGLVIAGLYVFLGVRFIPQSFGTSGGQGFTIVFLSVLVPHVVLLVLFGYRLGFLS